MSCVGGRYQLNPRKGTETPYLIQFDWDRQSRYQLNPRKGTET